MARILISMPDEFLSKVDSVADGAICKTKTHGYWSSIEAAEAADETHVDAYNGYT